MRAINDVNALEDLFTSGVVTESDRCLLVSGDCGHFIQSARQTRFWLPDHPASHVSAVNKNPHTNPQSMARCVCETHASIPHLNEAIQGIRVTKAFVQEDENEAFFLHLNDDYRVKFNQSSKVGDLFMPVVDITGAVGVCIATGTVPGFSK